jgi:hypothetical protein
MDASRYNFKDIKITNLASAEGDKAFDEEALSSTTFPGPHRLGLPS